MQRKSKKFPLNNSNWKDSRRCFYSRGVKQAGRKVSLHNQEINLTAKEFDLLLLLITNPGKVFSREELLEIIWGYEYFGDLRTVDVHVRRLREKIENKNKAYEYILTKWGVGYYFRTKNWWPLRPGTIISKFSCQPCIFKTGNPIFIYKIDTYIKLRNFAAVFFNPIIFSSWIN